MKISTLFKACIFVILALFVLIFYSGRELLLSKEMHATMLENKERLETAGQQLGKGSDYLTNEIRRYTQFGDEKHFQNFWKEVNENKSREVADDLKLLGALPSEIEFIKKSKSYSDNLINVEQQAMEAVKKGELEKARKLVFGEYYDQQKALILGNIRKFQVAINNRTVKELEKAHNETNFYLSLSILLVCLIGFFVLFGFYFLGLKKLVPPLSKISEIISESLKSDSIIKVPYENNKDEVGILSSAFNQLIYKRETLENELKASNKNLEKVVNKQTAQLKTEAELYKILLTSIQFQANSEEEIKKGLEILLDNICSVLNWDLGHIYFVSGSGDKLISQSIWYSSDEARFEEFISVSSGYVYKKGEGLPGRVWKNKNSIWIENILTDANFPRAARVNNFNLKSGYAVPILLKDNVFAVIEFFSEMQRNSDQRIINLLENIALQIGKSFERLEQDKLIRDTSKEAVSERARLSKIMENLIDGLIIIDSQGIIKSINSAVTNQFGYSSSELIGQNVKMIMPEPYHSEHDQYLKSYLTTGKAKIIGMGREVVGLRKDGSTFDLDLGITQLDTHEGTSFIGTLRDITERKRAEQEIVVAREEAVKASRAKSLFLANMSHEIRTPMNAVLGYSQILLRNKHLDRETLDSIRTIDNSGKNLLKMINEILDISKIEAGKMELNLSDFDLNTLIDNLDSMFELRCRQKQLKWTIDAPSGPIIVRADEVKLRQVLINLLGNAVKFTDSGEVTLSIKALENNHYRFNVTDTGNGITKEVQSTIFEAFQQEEEGAKKGGTGLGLAISKKQLELMSSELHLESKVNEGSSFYFTITLPPVEGEHYIDRRGKHRNVLHLKPECSVKALVVDDVKENRDVLAKLLSSIGVEVLEAVNGKEGVEKTIEHQPDIVFMDMRMPVMRGEDAVKLIVKEFGRDRIKIVTITASALDRRREYFLEMGCHEFISKPFTTEQIYSCLDELLGVDYVYDEDEEEKPSSSEKLDLSKLSIPKDLYEKMKESAENYNITYLEKALEELQQRDGASDQLYEHITKLSKAYDMDKIINVLESISKISD